MTTDQSNIDARLATADDEWRELHDRVVAMETKNKPHRQGGEPGARAQRADVITCSSRELGEGSQLFDLNWALAIIDSEVV